MLTLRLALTGSLLALAACAPRPSGYRALPLASLSQIQSTDVTVLLAQRSVSWDGASAAPSPAQAEATLQPIRDALRAFDVGEELREHLDEHRPHLAKLGPTPAKVLRKTARLDREAALGASQADALLFVDASYRFTDDFSALIVSTDAALLPAAPAGGSRRGYGRAGPDSALYLNTQTVEIRMDVPSTAEEHRERWLDANGTTLRTVLHFAVMELSRLIVGDLIYETGAAPARPAAAPATDVSAPATPARQPMRMPDASVRVAMTYGEVLSCAVPLPQ